MFKLSRKWPNKVICKLSQLMPTKLQWFVVFISYSGAKEQKRYSLQRKQEITHNFIRQVSRQCQSNKRDFLEQNEISQTYAVHFKH